MGCGQGLPVRGSVLSIHGIQVFGFNDSGQQLVAGRWGEIGRKMNINIESGRRQRAPIPAFRLFRPAGPASPLPTLLYRMGIMAIMMRGKIIFM